MESGTDPNASISILFVEDDELILKIQVSILTSKFPDVVFYTAINGRTGLELFKAHTPEIVLTDINMSEMCGVQMSQAIQAIRPDTKVIAITGRSGETGANGKFILRNPDGIVVVFDHVIIKPVDLSELFAVIETCIADIRQKVQ